MKRGLQIAAGVLAGVLLAGCAQEGVETEGPVDSGRLQVVCSFYTMADFAGKIAGDRADVEALAPAGAEPHDWEPGTRDIARLEAADVLILSGAGFEHWVDGILPTLENQDLMVVDTSAAVALLEGGSEDREDHADDDHGHSHELDPHVWLDPMNAKAQLLAIHDALVAADSEGMDLYNANLNRWMEECDRLDEEYHDALDSLANREIVVAHAAFGYLCARYDLTQVAVQGLAPEGEPDPARMAEVVRTARDHGARVIFFERAASPKVAEAIAREIGAETAVLDPIEGISDERTAAGEDYFSVMRENLKALKKALTDSNGGK